MSPSKIKIGLFGFGCVGQGLYTVMQETHKDSTEIIKICVKDRTKERPLSPSLFTFDKNDILNNPDVQVVVELIDNADEAFEIVSTALKNGKAVVSANKKMIAEHFRELYSLQQEHNVPLLYEAAVCASIPIIRSLEEYYDNDLLTAVKGIMNGSTNFILSRMLKDGKTFAEALAEAQQLGFAESNPTLDIEGFDPKFKLAIILTHAFGLFVSPEKIFNYGITRIDEFDMQFATEKGYKIKLCGIARKRGDKVFAAVLPKFVTPNDIFYHIDNEYNGIQFESIFSEKQFFTGKGAGSLPTGMAVLSDITALMYNYRYEYKKFIQKSATVFDDDTDVKAYIRFYKDEDIDQTAFKSIEQTYKSKKEKYIIGTIPFRAFSQSKWIRNDGVNVILMPGQSKLI